MKTLPVKPVERERSCSGWNNFFVGKQYNFFEGRYPQGTSNRYNIQLYTGKGSKLQ